MQTRGLFTLAASVSSLGLWLSSAQAADPPADCPPGEWFCGRVAEPAGPPPEESPPDDADADTSEESSDSWVDEGDGRSDSARSGAEDDDGRVDVRTYPEDGEPEQFGLRRDGLSPWSVNLRLEGALLGQSRRSSGDSGLGGLGASLRYEVTPVLTLDLGLDSILGTDYNGYDRNEFTASFSSLLYFNPDQLIRTYAILGLNTTAARVSVEGEDQSWGYFGAHAGLGLDFAVDRKVALNIDLIGFIRGRTDERAAREPEFNDGFGRVTNTAGGGLFRGGISLYW
jgi:outer membrane protein with beta-barrel domain